jgi:hypothetical protein
MTILPFPNIYFHHPVEPLNPQWYEVYRIHGISVADALGLSHIEGQRRVHEYDKAHPHEPYARRTKAKPYRRSSNKSL